MEPINWGEKVAGATAENIRAFPSRRETHGVGEKELLHRLKETRPYYLEVLAGRRKRKAKDEKLYTKHVEIILISLESKLRGRKCLDRAVKILKNGNASHLEQALKIAQCELTEERKKGGRPTTSAKLPAEEIRKARAGDIIRARKLMPKR